MIEVKCTYTEMLQMWACITTPSMDGIVGVLQLPGRKWAITLERNCAILKTEMKTFEELKQKIQLKHCLKDEQGVPVTRQEKDGKTKRFTFPDEPAFEAELDALLAEEIELQLHEIEEQHLPENISGIQVKVLRPFILPDKEG